MFSFSQLREIKPKIISLGSYPAILQSILDFDFILGRENPSLVGIFAGGRKFERYFWGKREILLPVFEDFADIPKDTNLFLNLTSGRRAFQTSNLILENLPKILGGVIFAENVPERDMVALAQKAKKFKKFIIGPASVGLLIPQKIKLGAIGGITPSQQIESHLFENGEIGIISVSGGMVNEIINILVQKKKGISFAISLGAERFPILSPKEAFLAANQDKRTSQIIYFGELGGDDEYAIAELLLEKKISKPVICYIAGTISEMFETPTQFGHAKAVAKKREESAQAKKEILRKAGARVVESFSSLVKEIEKLKVKTTSSQKKFEKIKESLEKRKPALFITTISKEEDDQVKIFGQDLIYFAKNHSLSTIVVSLFLGRKIKSKLLEDFIDLILRLLVDHGPSVSGAINTMISARAGKDLISSLTSGLLTIGPRFGGALNEAAKNWISAIERKVAPFDFVEEFSNKKIYIAGIGHRRYSINLPDPRVKEILAFTNQLKEKKFSNFALEVEKITTAKRGNLILNVDGAIAAVLLDILAEEEKISLKELKQLTEIEFFNTFFVLSRAIGFIAHFLDQKRLDEGLFRLDREYIREIKPPKTN